MIPAMIMYFAPEFKIVIVYWSIAKRMQRSFTKYSVFIRSHLELGFWLLSIVALFFLNNGGPSLCLFRFAGIDWCPGCGLGHAIHAALHLDFATSFHEHPFGIPALLIIAHRIIQLISKPKLHYEQQ